MTTGLGTDPHQTALLKRIYQLINNANQLQDILYELEQLVLELFKADRFTLYRKNGNELVSWYLTGRDIEDQIRVPIGPSSIAGYVAWAMEPVRINDVYNQEELHQIHPNLGFDYGFDQSTGYMTQSMVVAPISVEDSLLGVIQIINKQDNTTFSEQDMIHAVAIANLLGKKFALEFRTDAGPYEYLITKGLISSAEFDQLEREAQKKQIPVTILLRRQKNIPREEIGKALETYYGIPWLPYTEEITPDQELLDRLNPAYLAQNIWCPFRTPQGKILVVLDDPNNQDKILEIQQLLGEANLDLRVGTQEDILRFLGYVYPEDEDPKEVALEDLVGKLNAHQITHQEDEGSEEAELLDENASAIIQLVNHIIIEAVKIGASDIHIEPMPGKEDAVVRMRVDGDCHIKLRIPHTHIRAVVARIKVLSKLDIAERRKPQDGKMAVKLEGKPLELRVATVPTVHGESAVLRVLASSSRVFTMDELNFRPPVYKGIEKMLEHPHGIILVVGPTGSGKTTTLHGILHRINTPDTKILTAEDPVEITQPGLQQVQILPQIGLTFAAALRSFLRADPDVILIGEMRDYETAQIGIEASLTGHLVFSTLHTNSAPETITRLLEMEIDPLNFADALIGVLAQRLVRTLCSKCKEPYRPSEEELERLIHYYGEKFFPELGIDLKNLTLYRPKGCDTCMNTGYRGRTGIHELLIATPEIKHLIAKKGVASQIRELAIQQGMRTLYQDGIAKILMGQFDLFQLRKVVIES